MEINPVELNAEIFKKYGQILSEYSDEPMADDDVITYWGKVAKLDFDKKITTGILFGHKRRMETKNLERHIDTPEVLVALKGDAVICVAAADKEGNKSNDINAFYVKQGDAIALNCGTWHWTPFPIQEQDCKFLVMFNNDTESNDLQIKDLDDAIQIKL